MTWQRVAVGVVYWLAVLVVSVAILVGLILLIESRDKSSVKEPPPAPGGARPLRPLRDLPRKHDDSVRGAGERVTRA